MTLHIQRIDTIWYISVAQTQELHGQFQPLVAEMGNVVARSMGHALCNSHELLSRSSDRAILTTHFYHLNYPLPAPTSLAFSGLDHGCEKPESLVRMLMDDLCDQLGQNGQDGGVRMANTRHNLRERSKPLKQNC